MVVNAMWDSSNKTPKKTERTSLYKKFEMASFWLWVVTLLAACGGWSGNKMSTVETDPESESEVTPSNTGIKLTGKLSEIWCNKVSINILWGDSINAISFLKDDVCLVTKEDKKKLEALDVNTFVYVNVDGKTQMEPVKTFLWKIIDVSVLSLALGETFWEDMEDVIKEWQWGEIIIDLDKDWLNDEAALKRLVAGLSAISNIGNTTVEDLINTVLATLSSITWPSTVKVSNTPAPVKISAMLELPEWTDKTFQIEGNELDIEKFVKDNVTISISDSILSNDNLNISIDSEWKIKIEINLDYTTVSNYSWSEMVIKASFASLPLLDREFSIDVVDQLKAEKIEWNILTAWDLDSEIKVTFNGDIEEWEVIFGELADYRVKSIEWNILTLSATPHSDYDDWSETVLVKVDWEEIEIPVTIEALDIEAPSIELNGASTINIVEWTTYTDQWADCEDNVSCVVTSSWTVDTSVVWPNTITYTATDPSWNTTQTTRTVNVTAAADIEAPSIELNGASIINIVEWTSYTDQWADCEDNVSCVVTSSWTVDTSVVWSNTITYTATDPSWNTTQTTRIVNILPIPNTPPVANDDEVSMHPDAYTIDVDVLSNDIDLDWDSLVIEETTFTQWTHWTVTLSGGIFTYTPNNWGLWYPDLVITPVWQEEPTAILNDSFEYYINDWNGWRAKAKVDVTVECPRTNVSIEDVYIPWFACTTWA